MLNLLQHPVSSKMLLKIKDAGFRTKFGMTAFSTICKKGKSDSPDLIG